MTPWAHRVLTGVKAVVQSSADKRFDPNDRSIPMTPLFDQPFLVLVAAAMTIFMLSLGYVSLTDRDPKAPTAND